MCTFGIHACGKQKEAEGSRIGSREKSKHYSGSAIGLANSGRCLELGLHVGVILNWAKMASPLPWDISQNVGETEMGVTVGKGVLCS